MPACRRCRPLSTGTWSAATPAPAQACLLHAGTGAGAGPTAPSPCGWRLQPEATLPGILLVPQVHAFNLVDLCQDLLREHNRGQPESLWQTMQQRDSSAEQEACADQAMLASLAQQGFWSEAGGWPACAGSCQLLAMAASRAALCWQDEALPARLCRLGCCDHAVRTAMQVLAACSSLGTSRPSGPPQRRLQLACPGQPAQVLTGHQGRRLRPPCQMTSKLSRAGQRTTQHRAKVPYSYVH